MTIPIERGVITSIDNLDPAIVADNPELLILLQKAQQNFRNWETADDEDITNESKALAEETGKKIGSIVTSAAEILTPEAEIALGHSALSPEDNEVLAVSLKLAASIDGSNK